jgi:hypothetical protein
MTTMFEIRPYRGGWQCFEAPGVQPFFVGRDAKRSAIDYAQSRTAHRAGEIRVLNAAGELEQTIPFDHRAVRQGS